MNSTYISSNGIASLPGDPEVHGRFLNSAGEAHLGSGLLNNNEKKKPIVHLPSTASKEDKFWTINDDYGFLT